MYTHKYIHIHTHARNTIDLDGFSSLANIAIDSDILRRISAVNVGVMCARSVSGKMWNNANKRGTAIDRINEKKKLFF